MSAFSLSKSPLCLVAMPTQMAFIMIGTTMMARQMIMTFMGFFRGFISGLDDDMLVCLATLQSYCLLSVFARGVDNLFRDKTQSYIRELQMTIFLSKPNDKHSPLLSQSIRTAIPYCTS